jgi:hypothetical protein
VSINFSSFVISVGTYLFHTFHVYQLIILSDILGDKSFSVSFVLIIVNAKKLYS